MIAFLLILLYIVFWIKITVYSAVIWLMPILILAPEFYGEHIAGSSSPFTFSLILSLMIIGSYKATAYYMIKSKGKILTFYLYSIKAAFLAPFIALNLIDTKIPSKKEND